MSLKWWNTNKMWLAPVAALIMWAVSVLCFVFGLSFKNPMGVMVGKFDVSILIAFSLSIANTIIQLIGNGKDPKDMDTVFRVGWGASYVLGIASNVNALLGILGMGNVWLEWMVATSLGTMIEVMPEKLIVIWLKTMNTLPKPQQQNNAPKKSSYPDKNIYRPSLPKKPTHPIMAKLPMAHSKPQPYPRQSPYLQAIQEMEGDEEMMG